MKGALAAAGVASAEVETTTLGVIAHVVIGQVDDALRALKDEGFTFLVDLFGTDRDEQIEVTYHLRSFSRDEEVYVRATLPYDATLPSVWLLFPAAAYPERELAELLGVRLYGHPHPRRLLTTDGCEPLLRKSVEIRDAEGVQRR